MDIINGKASFEIAPKNSCQNKTKITKNIHDQIENKSESESEKERKRETKAKGERNKKEEHAYTTTTEYTD